MSRCFFLSGEYISIVVYGRYPYVTYPIKPHKVAKLSSQVPSGPSSRCYLFRLAHYQLLTHVRVIRNHVTGLCTLDARQCCFSVQYSSINCRPRSRVPVTLTLRVHLSTSILGTMDGKQNVWVLRSQVHRILYITQFHQWSAASIARLEFGIVLCCTALCTCTSTCIVQRPNQANSKKG